MSRVPLTAVSASVGPGLCSGNGGRGLLRILLFLTPLEAAWSGDVVVAAAACGSGFMLISLWVRQAHAWGQLQFLAMASKLHSWGSFCKNRCAALLSILPTLMGWLVLLTNIVSTSVFHKIIFQANDAAHVLGSHVRQSTNNLSCPVDCFPFFALNLIWSQLNVIVSQTRLFAFTLDWEPGWYVINIYAVIVWPLSQNTAGFFGQGELSRLWVLLIYKQVKPSRLDGTSRRVGSSCAHVLMHTIMLLSQYIFWYF